MADESTDSAADTPSETAASVAVRESSATSESTSVGQSGATGSSAPARDTGNWDLPPSPPQFRSPGMTKPRRARGLAAWRTRLQLFTMVIALVDVALMIGAVLLGYAVLTALWPLLPADWQDASGYLHASLHVWYKTALVAFTIVAIYTFAVHGLYRPPVLRQRGAQAALALRAVSVLSAFFYFAVWMDRTNYCIERQIVILAAWLMACAFLAVWRGVVVPHWMSVGLWRRNTVILGAGESGQFVAGQQRRFDRAGFELIGFLDDKPELAPGTEVAGLPVLGAINDDTLGRLTSERPVHEAVLAISNLTHARILEIVSLCKRHGLGIRMLSDRWGILAEKVNVETVSGVALIGVRETPLIGLNAAVKRLIDVVGSLFLLILLSPLLLTLVAIIRLTSKGPAVFVQERVGTGGRLFRYYKFRSMRVDNDDSIHREFVKALIRGEDVGTEDEEGQKVRKIVDDPRVTPVGRFIRKYSLDELPQLVNVLKGDMSLVGPRPSLPYEVEAQEDWHRKRLDVRPGLTGLWQVSGRSEVTFDDMVVLDLWYIENWSLWLDIRLLLATPFVVVARKGAH